MTLHTAPIKEREKKKQQHTPSNSRKRGLRTSVNYRSDVNNIVTKRKNGTFNNLHNNIISISLVRFFRLYMYIEYVVIPQYHQHLRVRHCYKKSQHIVSNRENDNNNTV